MTDNPSQGAVEQTWPLTKSQIEILDHTVRRAPGGYFCGGGADMASLVDAGLMVSAGRKSFVPDEYFQITTAGRTALKAAMLKK
jgi:hypothetical protein